MNFAQLTADSKLRMTIGSKIRLVTFDALHTLVTPRIPVYVKYTEAFEPYYGKMDPQEVKVSFKKALKRVQINQPSYNFGAWEFWREVMKWTVVETGIKEKVVEASLNKVVDPLLEYYSSKEAYRLYDDALPAVRKLRENEIKTGLVSNCDARMLDALIDLDIYHYLQPIIISEKEGIEKPHSGLYHIACETAGVPTKNSVHVGDELENDYRAAEYAEMTAFLLRREGPDGEAYKEEEEDPTRQYRKPPRVVKSLMEVVDWVLEKNK